jgi:hypothetical protein
VTVADEATGDGEPTTQTSASDVGDETGRMRRAISEIRREGWKVAIIYATVDATLAMLGANLLLSVWQPPSLPARMPIPTAVRETLGLSLAEPTVATSAVVGVGLALLVFVLEVAVRTRRPLVEHFEAANPDLRESLRTARDSVRSGSDSRIARRLYEDVLAGLRESSSIGLLNLRRVGGTVVLITLLSLATIQVAVVDLQLGGPDGVDTDGPDPDEEPGEFGGLQDGDSILGDSEDVPSGVENLEAEIDTSGSGSGGGADADAAAYENSGYGGTVESQRAAFAEEERVEDAALIREYTIRISEGADA